MTLVGIGAQKLELATSWPELGLIVILLLVMIYVVVKVSIIIRWCFTGMYAYLLVVIQLPRDHSLLKNCTSSPAPSLFIVF
jgi:hypothetical protein